MPPGSTAVGVKDLFLWSLLLPLVGALQQPPYNGYPAKSSSDELSDRAAASAHRWESAVAESLHAPLSGPPRDARDSPAEKDRKRTRASSNERALAALSPAESNPAVRAPPAPKSPAPSAGLSSRQPARSLQDWQVEDIVLLATVDGKIHAHDRRTGAAKWQLETDRPMVETIYHNKSRDENGMERQDPLWIVEPSQDGSIYVYAPDSGFGMQRLGYTVKRLADISPWASDAHPAVAYTAEKKNTLYTVDASNGLILKTFSSAGSIVNDERNCRRVNLLESLDEEECEPIGTLTLGRIEYTIGIQDSKTGEMISTIRYFEWVPNNRDVDLRREYTTTMDKKYVYTKHDGTVFGLDFGSSSSSHQAVSAHKPSYWHKFSSPVARVYDIVRPHNDMSADASLVVLPQPIGPSPNDFAELDEDLRQSIYVNCTDAGSWYALSETNYPTVTEGATLAQCYRDMLGIDIQSLISPMSQWVRERFIGVHRLSSSANQRNGPLQIGYPEYPGLEPPPDEANDTKEMVEVPASRWDSIPSVRTLILTLFLAALACGPLYAPTLRRKVEQSKVEQPQVEQPVLVPSPSDIVLPVADDKLPPPEEPHTPMVREAEPAKEIIFPHEEPEQTPEPKLEEVEEVAVADNNDVEEIAKEAEEVAKEVVEPKKKKATRGRRGGKKQKEKEQLQAEAREKKKQNQVPQAAEIITVAASESPQVAGPLQINSLTIHTDKVIGQGSCGTSVFEGAFEGREVAVKRMLSQYYDLASQEVSFLQQSDDHPNVIRYFCQQKDDHFLYIAVELCQASLFEVWEAEKARTDERQAQLRSLKFTIQRDVPKVLHQLAAGLYHLHNLRIIHRDIKPQNILVAFPKRNQNNGPRLVISDFGLGKNLPENVSTLVDPTGNAGTAGWKAPELISQPRETLSLHSQSNSQNGGSEIVSGTASGVKRAADIFSLGCLFFWVLTDGVHPFEDENGWHQLRELNIKRDNKKMGVLERWSDAYEPMQLITSMLEHQPENRPTALQVLNHPFFWPPEKRLRFLCDCSDHFEGEPRGTYEDYWAGDSEHLRLLEDRAEEVMNAPIERADFLSKLDRQFVDTLGRQRKYNGDRLLDLLRALRNKKNHYEDMPEDVKRRVGGLPGGYLQYWSYRFPRLLMVCYAVVHEIGLERHERFRGYFALGSN